MQVRATINDTKVSIIVSTGSTYSYMGQQVADRLGLSYIPLTLELMDTSNRPLTLEVAKVNVQFLGSDAPSFQILFAVLHGGPDKIVLGNNFLRGRLRYIDPDRKIVTFENNGHTYSVSWFVEENPRSYFLPTSHIPGDKLECAECHELFPGLPKCEKCEKVYFCTTECHEAHLAVCGE